MLPQAYSPRGPIRGPLLLPQAVRMQHRILHVALPALMLVLACSDPAGPGAPASVAVVQPTVAEAAAGVTVAGPVVRVLDAAGRGVPGVPVSFTVLSGGGSVAATPVVSDGAGTAASPPWKLGTGTGPQRLAVTVPDLPAAEVTVLAVPGGAQGLRLEVAPPVTARSGVPLATAPTVHLADRYGNPVLAAGVAVTVTLFGATGAEVHGGQAVTDGSGRARFDALVLEGRAGSYTLRFRAGQFPPLDAPTTALEGGPAVALRVEVEPWSLEADGPLTRQPVIVALDAWGNTDALAGGPVTAAVSEGVGQLTGPVAALLVEGRAAFSGLGVAGDAPVRLRFTHPELPAVDAPPFTPGQGRPCVDGTRLALDGLAAGQMMRFAADDPAAPACLDFLADRDAGESFLVLFEDVPRGGSYGNALFPGSGSDAGPMPVTVRSAGATEGLAPVVLAPAPAAAPSAPAEWSFGTTPLREGTPEPPAGVTPRARLLGGSAASELAAVRADLAVGDTVQVYMEGIPRLGIGQGWQRAVVRHVSDRLAIAEDVRLGSLTREGGGLNRPMTAAQMQGLAEAYAAFGGPQGDRQFSGRFNQAIEAATPPRVLAVHSLMYGDGIWGYTYPSGDYFIWDYWAGTDGQTPGLSQHPQRIADHLITHEVAHMRHWGVQERTGRTQARGHRWLVEGFARHSERWAVAARLLGSAEPSRTANAVLPRNPAYGGSYVRDDVPTFLYAGRDFTAGYAGSSYVFDYLADQVAWRGGDWLGTLVDFVARAGVPADADAAVAAAGIDAADLAGLITRARIALWADDHPDFPGLAPWTQYHQYDLRASRPAGSAAASDPRVLWPWSVPGHATNLQAEVESGGAWGFLIHGAEAPQDARYQLTYPPRRWGAVSVTRLR